MMQYNSNLKIYEVKESESVLTILGNEMPGFDNEWFCLNSNQQDLIVMKLQKTIENIKEKSYKAGSGHL